MDALVIGAGGFVGKYLLRQLLEEGQDAGATKLPHERIGLDGVEEFDLDLTNQNAVTRFLSEHRPTYIYHLAAQSSVAVSWKQPELTVDVNIKGTLHLLEAVHSIEGYYPRILLVGSGEEYGYLKSGACPIPETEALHPGNIYAVTKACQNMLGSVYARAYGMAVIMVRAFNHIGVGQAPIFVAADFALQIAEMEAGLRPPVMQVGNLEAKRDFSDVRDVVRAYTLLMQRGIAGETYNVGSGHAVPVRQILDTLLDLSTESIAVEQDPKRLRPSDVPVIEADITKLREDTGWEPLYPLEETLHTMLDHNRRNFGIL